MINIENELFSRWRVFRDNLCPDGIVDYETYLKCNQKILFILKEANSDESIDLRLFAREGGRRQTWSNLARWVYGINNLNESFSWNKLVQPDDLAFRKKWLKQIIVMNLKKIPGSHTAKFDEVVKFAKLDSELLNEQFNLYNNNLLRPDWIVACGTDVSDTFLTHIELNRINNWKQSKNGINFFEYTTGKYFIKYVHPEARLPDNFLFFPLIDTIKEINAIQS